MIVITAGNFCLCLVELMYWYCSKTQGGAGRERGDTHRTRTGAEQHHTPAQTPTPARTATRTHPDRS